MAGSVGSLRAIAGAVAVVGLLLVGCGSDGGGADEPSAGPMAELFGWNDFNSAEQRREQLEIEEVTASCMREEGFEYIPVDYEAQFDTTETDEDIDLFSDPEAFGKKYGYGVVRNYELYELPNLNEDGSGPGGSEFEDPNQDYLSSLSETETNDYFATLYGQQSMTPDTVPIGTEPEIYISPPLEEQGCSGRARLDVVGEDPSQDPDVQRAMNEYYESQQDDPELEQAQDRWADCMVEPLAGIEFPEGMKAESPESMYSMMESKKAEAAGQQILPLDPETGEPIGEYDDSMGYSSMQNEDGTGFAFVGEIRAIEADELERLRKLEIELWEQDWSCQQDADIQKIRTALEQSAVDDLLQQFPELGSSEGG